MKNFIQRSFRRELLVSFLAVSVLPLIVCCVFLIQMFKVKVGRDFEKKDMELAGAVEQQLMTLTMTRRRNCVRIRWSPRR